MKLLGCCAGVHHQTAHVDCFSDVGCVIIGAYQGDGLAVTREGGGDIMRLLCLTAVVQSDAHLY